MLTIDPSLPTPPYEQLRAQLIAQITNGELSPGVKLPPVRRLASDLGLAANTVARTYRELESAGFVQTLGRNGTIVAPDLDEPETHDRALRLTQEYTGAMRALGIDAEGIAAYVRRIA